MSKWEMVRLGDVATYVNGFAFKPADWSNKGIPIIRIQNLTGTSDVVNYYDKKYSTKYEINNGDVLISWSASLGVYEWKKGKALLNQHIFKVVFDKLVLDKRFFVFVIAEKLREMSSLVHGSTMKHITKKYFDRIEIQLPPLESQKKIATALDSDNALIEKRKEQIEKLDLLIKSQFIEMFGDPVTNPKGWEKKQLSKLIVHANNGMARRGNDIDGDIVLRLVELQDGFLDYSKPNRILLSEFEKKRYLLFKNDFLFARVNGNPDYVGRCAVFHDIGEDVYYNDHIIRVRFDDSQLQGCFVSTLLNSQYGKRQMRSKIKTSAGQYTISQDGIGAIEIICPPLSLQTQFAKFVEKVEAQKALLQKSLADMEQNYQSFMQKCFKGEIF